jgi:hypothetical protein
MFFLVIEKSEGYNCFRVKLLIHLSSQNLILCPLFNWKHPRLRNVSLTFNMPLQKWESLVSFAPMQLCLQIFFLQNLLPQTIFIYKLKQLFAKKTSILYIYILNSQPSLVFRLTKYTPFCYSVFLLMLIALPIESRYVLIYLLKNSSRDFKEG